MSRQNTNYSSSLTAPRHSDDKAHTGNMERYDSPSITGGPPVLFGGTLKNAGTSMSFRYDEGALSVDESEMFFDLVFQAGINDQKMKDLLTFVRTL